MTDKHSFIILGTGGVFTLHVIRALIKTHTIPLAYIQSGNQPRQNETTFASIKLEVLKPRSALFQLLESKNIPVYFQSNIELATLIQQLKVEFLLVACWPELLPDKVLQLVSKAALNLHPSLLPKYRGIDPVGEQIKANDNNFGISLHLINETFDAGDIVLQQALQIDQVPEKINIEIKAAKKGADLFVLAINTYKNPGWQLIRQ